MLDIAEKYLLWGLNPLPVKSDKRPVGKWKHLQTEKQKPNGQFTNCWGIAILCGKISNNLEIIDIDTKYDLTGTLFENYKQLINAADKELLKKLVVEQSSSGGYHFIYRCSIIEGNQKLAQRHTTESEKEIGGQNDVTRDLIETRGEGGYFVCDPSPKYKLISGDFSKVVEISVQERSILFDCAKALNEVFEQETYITPDISTSYSHSRLNPFDDFNERFDLLSFLQSEGWKLVLKRGSHNFVLRPGGTSAWSADYDTDKKLLYVFSTSTGFESEKAYNNIQVFKKYKFNNATDKEVAKWLFENGYGEQNNRYSKIKHTQLEYVGKSTPENKYDFDVIKESPIKINFNDDNFDFLIPNEKTDDYLKQIRDGTFQLGLTTGIPTLDGHFRMKEANVNVVLGHDNVGKSNVVWYLAVLSAKLHGWKWALHHSENKTGGVKRKLIEYAACCGLSELSEEKYLKTKQWVEEYFYFLAKDDNLTYREFLLMGEKLAKKKKLNALLIDPYNSLYKPQEYDRHEWDYNVMAAFRTFTEVTGSALFLNCHAVTEALRKKYDKKHEYAGFPMPPDKADTEGGGKFSNRADNFLTIHRLVQHEKLWNTTEIHVRKIKEMETGGRQTVMDKPVLISSIRGAVGFVDKNGYNPITGIVSKQSELKIDERISQSKTKEEDNDPF